MPKERFDAASITTTHFTEPGVILATEAERDFSEKVSDCQSFEALFALLRTKADGIQGTSRIYPPEEVITRIERVRNGHDVLQRVTRTFGINSKVEELLQTDKTFAKRVLNRK